MAISVSLSYLGLTFCFPQRISDVAITTTSILFFCVFKLVLEAAEVGNFSKAFESMHRIEVEPILLANGLPKETVIILYKNTKVKVRSLAGNAIS